MTQMSEYKPLEDEDFEYEVSCCPKKPKPYNLFFIWTRVNVLQGKQDFYPIF